MTHFSKILILSETSFSLISQRYYEGQSNVCRKPTAGMGSGMTGQRPELFSFPPFWVLVWGYGVWMPSCCFGRHTSSRMNMARSAN